MTATTATVSLSYRSSDAANTRLNLFAGSGVQSTPPVAQYSRSLSDSPTALTVTVPTLTATTLTCSASTCTTTIGLTNPPEGATVSAFLVPSASYYSSANPALTQGQAASASMALSFTKPADGSYVVMVYLNPTGSSGNAPPVWSWSLRGATTLTVATAPS